MRRVEWPLRISRFPVFTHCSPTLSQCRGRVGTSGSTGTENNNASKKQRKLSDSAAALSRSVDLAKQEEANNVERYFPSVMSHIKATPKTPYVADQRRAEVWKDVTRTVHPDGYHLPKEDAESPPSFFDEDSLDIRRTSGTIEDQSRRLRRPNSVKLPRRELISPDILQLSGGNNKTHGHALAEESNLSPADPTIEPDSGEHAYGDTPMQLTDMLKERLMELKAEKLREDRNDTYLPARLRLISDSQLHKMTGKEASTRKIPGRSLSNLRFSSTTLADVIDHTPGKDKPDKSNSAVVPSSAPGEGKSNNVITTLIRKTADLAPGGSILDPLSSLEKSAAMGKTAVISPRSGVHLLRCLPRAGFCSRREALAIIASGQVRVDNVLERNPFRLVQAENDIHVASHKGRLRFAPPRLWMYHKPAYVVVSRNDVAGRTLFTKHARILGMDHLIPVGSLPMRAHGLMLLTNDGELSRYLENPSHMIQQTYLLRVRPAIDAVLAHKLNTKGVALNGRLLNNIEFLVNPAMKSRFSLKVKVRGESMPIANLMLHLGRVVERGGRISFGPFSLGGLPVGSLREVTVPPHYTQHAGEVWKEFVERDWPFFRRQRAVRLKRLARYRELTPREVEELESFTHEELKDALSFQSHELKGASEEWLTRFSVHPALNEPPLPNDFGDASGDGSCTVAGEDEIIKDITAAT
ncbi:hypothetical protein ERJ75_000976100 [Trypanosoma vivax]|nr:hypothetical protein ERJ75_000976100 [Trypanosoma vivax]